MIFWDIEAQLGSSRIVSKISGWSWYLLKSCLLSHIKLNNQRCARFTLVWDLFFQTIYQLCVNFNIWFVLCFFVLFCACLTQFLHIFYFLKMLAKTLDFRFFFFKSFFIVSQLSCFLFQLFLLLLYHFTVSLKFFFFLLNLVFYILQIFFLHFYFFYIFPDHLLILFQFLLPFIYFFFFSF